MDYMIFNVHTWSLMYAYTQGGMIETLTHKVQGTLKASQHIIFNSEKTEFLLCPLDLQFGALSYWAYLQPQSYQLCVIQ